MGQQQQIQSRTDYSDKENLTFLSTKQPTIEIRPEVAIVSFHEFLNCWLKLRVIPLTPLVAREHATTDKRREEMENWARS